MSVLQITLCLTVIGAGFNTHAHRFRRDDSQLHRQLVSQPPHHFGAFLEIRKCSPENPCKDGEGDCDSNDHSTCAGDLVCGDNNCRNFHPYTNKFDDCCERPLIQELPLGSYFVEKPTPGACTEYQPCTEGEGVCHDDSTCAGRLVCGSNNCRQFHPYANQFDDCCVRPTIRKLPVGYYYVIKDQGLVPIKL